tara:strand:- start:253 stop:453 length:201 start_codon:yes stop_codon:yes gene_type:complete
MKSDNNATVILNWIRLIAESCNTVDHVTATRKIIQLFKIQYTITSHHEIGIEKIQNILDNKLNNIS